MTLLVTSLMQTILQVINITIEGLPDDDITRLRLVEIRPRAEEFADLGLSCSISHNDPDDWNSWNDEEAAAPGSQYQYYAGSRHLELGLNQPMAVRFTIDFQLFYLEFGTPTEEAIEAGEIILARIHHALMVAGQYPNSLFGPLFKSDEFGNKLIDAARCVKRMRIISQGSDEETFMKAKMWLQFTTLYEPELVGNIAQYVRKHD